jgi:hypothetical protein
MALACTQTRSHSSRGQNLRLSASATPATPCWVSQEYWSLSRLQYSAGGDLVAPLICKHHCCAANMRAHTHQEYTSADSPLIDVSAPAVLVVGIRATPEKLLGKTAVHIQNEGWKRCRNVQTFARPMHQPDHRLLWNLMHGG